VESIVGPEKLEDFKVAHKVLENQAAIYLLREYGPW
jgi:hypothetical protein